MDETTNKHAYRCLPLKIANTFGWDVYAPCDFVVTWNGGIRMDDLQINFASTEIHPFCASNFGSGIFTLHSGYLFKTDPGWDIMATGPINEPVTFASPCSGIVETSWLNFTFTMNWILHEPGTYTWDSSVPVARIFPIPHEYEVETELVMPSEDPEAMEEYNMWCIDRETITEDLMLAYAQEKTVGQVEYGTASTEWEKTYFQGKDKHGNKIDDHITNRKFPEF